MKDDKKYIPPERMVMDILNGAPEAGKDVVMFYEKYIRKMAMESVYSAEGETTGTYYNEDLAQELRIGLLNSLPSLRKVLVRQMEDGKKTARKTNTEIRECLEQ